jgi:nucleoside-diphosphate-sugar epimerase
MAFPGTADAGTRPRRVLVTGASGFVGSHLAAALAAQGDEVTCLLRASSDRRWLAGVPLRIVTGSLGDADSLGAAVAGQEVVFHAAGAVRAWSLAEFLEVNAAGTARLCRACREAQPRPRRLVLVSSLAANGPGPHGLPATEAQRPRPLTDYGRSKLAGEREALAFAGAFEVAIVRPTAVYGPRDAELLPLFQGARHGLVPALAGARQVLNLCHVDDIVAGTILAGAHPAAAGEAFLLAAEDASLGEVAGIVCRLNGRRPCVVTVPRPLLVGVALAVEAAARVRRALGLRAAAPMLGWQKLPELTQPSWAVDTTKARRLLGYAPRWSLAAGLAATRRWYQEVGWLPDDGQGWAP